MKRTIEIRDDLLRMAEQWAVRDRRTLSDLVEEGLRAILAEKRARQTADFDLPVSSKRGGTLPGVDINNNAALLDILDRN